MDRLIEFLNFLILATGAGSIDWNKDKEELNTFILIDPDNNTTAVKVVNKGNMIGISITGSKHIIQIDTDQFPSLKDKLAELYDAISFNAAWNSDDKRGIISDMYESMDRLVLRLG